VERVDWWSLGPLESVTEYLFGDGPSSRGAVKLRFRDGTVVATAMPDTDELEVRGEDEPVPRPLDEAPDDSASRRLPWSEVVGLEVSWGWRLTNHQGYADGYELEFKAGDNPSRTVLVRMVVMASAIDVRLLG
jgi:hypothetical protein